MKESDGTTHICLRVVVDHNRRFTHCLESKSSIDCAPIEFYRASDSIYTAPKDDCAVVVERHVMARSIICSVEVISLIA